MSKYKANPQKLPNNTQGNEQQIYVGKRPSVEMLPAIFKTDTNRRFLDSTLDQLLSSGSTETLDTYWGRVSSKNYIFGRDLFADEHSAQRRNYQLAPGYGVVQDLETQDAITYISVLNSLKQSGADITDVNRLMSEPGYVLDLPINVDMFINNVNYYWYCNGDSLPVCEITATATDPIDIDQITLQSSYTTPVLANGKTLTLVSGMLVKFTGDYVTTSEYKLDAVYYVENVGNDGIRLIEKYDETGRLVFLNVQQYSASIPSRSWDRENWDTTAWDYSEFGDAGKEYIVVNRSGQDRNPWVRANQWHSIYAIKATVEFNDLEINDYISSERRAQRPIIEWHANYELFNTGTRDLTPVTHLIDDVADPATTIVGQELYRHHDDLLLDNDRVLFFNAGTYSNKIYRVTGFGTSIALVLESDESTLVSGDKVLVLHHQGTVSGAEYYWNGTSWVYGQQKQTRGSAPKFNLYDSSNIALSSYADTDFAGDYVFKYTANSAGVVDRELGFAPKFNSERNNNDISFDLTLNNTRYYQNLGTDLREEISGYYYIKNRSTGKFNNLWTLIREGQHAPILQTHIVTDETESVKFKLASEDLGYSTQYYVSYSQGYRWSTSNYASTDEVGTANPLLVFQRGVEYSIVNLIADAAHDLEFVTPLGVTDPEISVTTSGQQVIVTVSDQYQYSSVIYRSQTDPEMRGTIVLVADTGLRLRLLKNGDRLILGQDFTITGDQLSVITAGVRGDVYDLEYTTQSAPDMAVVQDIAPVHKYNPMNAAVSQVGFANLLNHFEDQLLAMPGIASEIFGYNDYYKLPTLHSYGGTIRQQIYSPAKMSYLSSRAETNPFNALVKASDDYRNFKTYFKNKVKQIWESKRYLGETYSVREIVDQALHEINLGKTNDFAYARSDMVYYEEPHARNMADYNKENEVKYYVIDDQTVFTLPQVENYYTDKKTHIYVWLTEYNGSAYVERPLIRNVDYTVSGNVLTLTNTVTLDGTNTPAPLVINTYGFEVDSYVPPSAAKLGFTPIFDVEIVDGVLYGHDGSQHVASGSEYFDVTDDAIDIVTACLYDFEVRVVSNIGSVSNNNIRNLLPTHHITNSYSWQDTTVRLDDWYNRWAARNNVVGYNSADYYNPADKFTWNYSTVYPYIGGWRGIYVYFFGTDRPHTHPWEILGLTSKPSWWDANYSWTDPVRRSALINAIRTGLTMEPGTGQCSILAARWNYDWDTNVLVDISGNLNDPVTAGVCADPGAVAASANFQFGDYGPYETDWRNSSEYTFALMEVLLQLKPYRVHELFWQINNIVKLCNSSTESVQYGHKFNNRRAGLDGTAIHMLPYENGIVRSVTVNAGGTGYNTSSTATLIVKNSRQPEFAVTTQSGAVVAVSVVDPGNGLYGDSRLDISGPLGSSGADATVDVMTGAVETVCGLTTTISEWAFGFGVSADSIYQTLGAVQSKLMLHVGGYTDKNIVDLILDGSYNRGRVRIPKQDFSVVLDKSSPTTSVYYSAVQVTKGDTGYTVQGFDTNNRKFIVAVPSYGGAAKKEEIGNLTVARYLKYTNETREVRYGTTFAKRQELYDFLLGLSKYYETQGFEVDVQWNIDARAVMEWSLADDPDPITVNGIADVLTFRQGAVGFVDNIGFVYDGTSNCVDYDGRQIKSKDLLVLRNETTTEFNAKDSARQIAGIRINVVEFEHVIAINNLTQFNDLVYDPATGLVQTRILVQGERTRNWNGRLEAPGYLVRTTGIVPSIESSVREVERDNINSSSKTLNKMTRDTARFNVGYVEPEYLTTTFVEDNAAYKFGQGIRKYKGTRDSISAIMRNINLFGAAPAHRVHDEWMIRLGDYGDKRQRNPIQFSLSADLIKSNPQSIRFNADYISDDVSDRVIDYHQGSYRLISGDITQSLPMMPAVQYTTNRTIEQSEMFGKFNKTAGLPLITETDYFLKSIDDIGSVYDSESEYANIPAWSDSVSYKRGDRVRINGDVYQCNVDYTGIVPVVNPLTIKGTVYFPSVPVNSTLIIDGTTITLAKAATTSTRNTIELTGTVNNPELPNNSSLSIDNATILFEKTQTVVTYDPINATGSVINPSFTGGLGKTFVINGTVIDFNQTSSFNTASLNPSNSTGATQVNWYGSAISGSVTGASDLYIDNTSVRFSVPGVTGTGPVSYYRTIVNSVPSAWISLGTQSSPITGYSEIDSVIVTIERATWPTGADFTANTNGVTDFQYNIAVRLASISEVPVNYTISSIVSRINSYAISDVIASNFENRLRITSTDTSLVIGAGTMNSALGFPVTSTVYTATSNTSVVGANSTLTEIVTTINNSNIVGVTASAVSGKLVLTSVNESLTVNYTTAVDLVGIPSGTFAASYNTTTTYVDSTIYDVIDAITEQNLVGITATNVDNQLVINSVNDSLSIGAGSANSYLGLSETILSASTVIEGETVAGGNVFDVNDWISITDPAQFSVWLVDNLGTTNISSDALPGYNVYQVFDFKQGIVEICAGNLLSDAAMVSTSADHNVEIGDYVMILGSTSTPNVDGIHRVIGVENETHFYIDVFIEEKGYGGKILPVKPTRFSSTRELNQTLTAVSYTNGVLGWRDGMLAYVDDIRNSGVSSNIGGVYVTKTNIHTGQKYFELIRSQTVKADNRAIKNAVIYDGVTQEKFAQLEVYDPVKGILPGSVEREINYTYGFDPATYSSTTDVRYTVNNNNAWDNTYVGKVWWDTSNAYYLDYEQSTTEYRQEYWGQLYPTSTVDVYEWTKSTVPPDQYAQAVIDLTVVDGSLLTGDAYYKIGQYEEVQYYWTEETAYDAATGRDETYYYFWVKNKTTTGNPDRQLTTTQIENMLLDPTGSGINWVAATGENSVVISNPVNYLLSDSAVVQINFQSTGTELHQEYALLAENDPALHISEWLHLGLRDSIAMYDRSSTVVDCSDYEIGVNYPAGAYVRSTSGNYFKAKRDTTTNPDVSTLSWQRVYAVVEDQDGLVDDTIPYGHFQIRLTTPNPVPDNRLHPYSRYGNQIRPRQSWIRDVLSARRVALEKINKLLLDINLVDTIPDWGDNLLKQQRTVGETVYDFTKFWSYADWVNPVTGYQIGTVPDRVVITRNELDLVEPVEGELALVKISVDADRINRRHVYRYVNGTWEIQFKEKATIQFNDLMWNYEKYSYGWDNGSWDYANWDQDPGALINDVLDTLYYDVFTGQYNHMYTEFWFAMMNYIISEQDHVDWIFKSTYIKTYVEHDLDHRLRLYQVQHEQELIDYINSVKPFHTKLRDSVFVRTADENPRISISSENTFDVTIRLNRLEQYEFGGLIVDGGANWASSDNEDYSLFTTADGDYDWIYDATGLVLNPHTAMDNDPELAPITADESVAITVTTNVSGSTVTDDTVRYRMFIDPTGELHSDVIRETLELAVPITDVDTEITLADLSSVVASDITEFWIGAELIEFSHFVGNTAVNCRRGARGTSPAAHDSGSVVYVSGPSYRIPIHSNIRSYVDNLRTAYNDPGLSLTDNTSVYYDADFIRRNS